MTKEPYFTIPGGVSRCIHLTQKNDELLRKQAKKKGDLSRIINELIQEKYSTIQTKQEIP